LRYLILSDIHANLEALESCLERAGDKYDDVICLGDLVGYGPDPNSVIDRMRGLARIIIRGNHDKACTGLLDPAEFNVLARMATDWTRRQLTAENFEFLRGLPMGPLDLDGFQIVHGSPLDEDEYILSPLEALTNLRAMSAPLVLFGHTHHQGGFLLSAMARFQPISCPPVADAGTTILGLADGGVYLVNPGSVGQPRDGDWRAAFAILDLDRKQVEYFRIPYDIGKTQAKMRAAGLPDPLIHRIEIGR
jgi:predicted phosphodiesterase